MPTYEIKSPEGQTYHVDAPKGASEKDAISYVQRHRDKIKPMTPDAPPHQMGILDRIGTGMRDPFEGAAQGISHLLPTPVMRAGNEFNNWLREQGLPLTEMPTGEDLTLDEYEKKREKNIETERGGKTGIDPYRVAGNIASPMNFAIPGAGAVTRGGRLVEAAAKGLTAGLMQPATSGDYAKEKESQALWGAAFGVVGERVIAGVSKVVAPVVGAAKKALMDAGVELTPGQIAGGILRRAEEAAKSFPILGSFIRGAEGRSIETFNKAVVNQVLEPIGEKLPDSAKAGREMIDYAALRLSAAYDNLLPQMKFRIDQQFANDMQGVKTLASEMPPDLEKQFNTIIANRLAERLQNGGGQMDGKVLKQVESELGHLGSSFKSSQDGAQRQLGATLDEVRMTIRSALERQNPAQAQALRSINSAYAMFVRAQGAAARRVGTLGIFTPNDLLGAIKSADKSVRKGDFARGDALMQDFAEFGQMVLPAKMPDSGSPERIIWDMLGLGTAIYNPKIPAGLVGASVPYTKVGTKAINAYASPGATRQAVGKGIDRLAEEASAATASAGTSARRDEPHIEVHPKKDKDE